VLAPDEIAFLTERHLGSLTTVRRNGTPHVVAIAFTYDPSDGLVRIITRDGSAKVTNVENNARAAVCQVDGRRWLTLEGAAVVTRQPQRVRVAVAAYERRYRPASPNPERVAIEITVDRVLGRA
jgi:F420H(2)-dependent biliverdin reductase